MTATRMTSTQINKLAEIVNVSGKPLGRLSNLDATVKRLRKIVVNDRQLMDLDTFNDLIDGDFDRAYDNLKVLAEKAGAEVNEMDVSDVSSSSINQESHMTENTDTKTAEVGKFTGKTKTPPSEKKAKMPKAEGEKKGGRGRASKYSGKVLFPAKETNPRQAGSFGWKSYQIILDAKDGITYEDYTKAGGRNNDLEWDVAHQYVTVVDPAAPTA